MLCVSQLNLALLHDISVTWKSKPPREVQTPNQEHHGLIVNISTQSQECKASKCWWSVVGIATDVPDVFMKLHEKTSWRQSKVEFHLIESLFCTPPYVQEMQFGLNAVPLERYRSGLGFLEVGKEDTKPCVTLSTSEWFCIMMDSGGNHNYFYLIIVGQSYNQTVSMNQNFSRERSGELG